MKKAVFITIINILDHTGNGGVKASQEHLSLVQKYFGRKNVDLCVYLEPKEMQEKEGIQIFEKPTKIKALISALFGCKVYLPWQEKELLQYIASCGPDYLILDFSKLGRLIRLKRGYKTIVFFHNIEADYAWNKVKHEGLFYLPSFWASKYNDRWASKADKVICLNERDSKRLYERYGREADLLIPISFRDSFDEAKTITKYKREILFLGSLFPPNQISIEWFLKNVMPKLNNIQLHIVGKDFEKKKSKYEKYPNVNVIGTVQEPASYYYRYSAVVMPIRYGAGMKVKTAEAMMYGRRIFASNEALEGYDVENVSGITRCNSDRDYAEAINHYFDCETQKCFEPEARKLFLEKYETSVQEKKFTEFMDINFI